MSNINARINTIDTNHHKNGEMRYLISHLRDGILCLEDLRSLLSANHTDDVQNP